MMHPAARNSPPNVAPNLGLIRSWILPPGIISRANMITHSEKGVAASALFRYSHPAFFGSDIGSPACVMMSPAFSASPFWVTSLRRAYPSFEAVPNLTFSASARDTALAGLTKMSPGCTA